MLQVVFDLLVGPVDIFVHESAIGRLVGQSVGQALGARGYTFASVEVEEALFGDESGLLVRVGPAERDPSETIYRYFGRTEAGRHLMLALLWLGRGLALPITAREMTPAERRRFDERRPRPR